MGVGDIDSDGDQDVIIRVWDEGEFGDTKNYDFESWMYAYTLEGKKLWEFNTKRKWERNKKGHFIEPCAMAPMTIWDFDRDGNDEILFGMLLLNEDLSIYIDGLELTGNVDDGRLPVRSFIADIDPDNPGYEWYFIRTESYESQNTIDDFSPKRCKGPYLVDVDQKKLLWHHNGTKSGYMGCGGACIEGGSEICARISLVSSCG